MSREYPCVYYDEQKCKKFTEDGYTSWCVLGPCSHETPSNADRIRAMSDEELATDLLDMFEEICEDGVPCKEWMLKWLKQPAEPPKED